jgi:hypothetical protein
MVVEINRMLGHPIRFDGVIVVTGRSRIRALAMCHFRQRLMPLCRLAPYLRQHPVVSRAFSGRHLAIIAFEVLHAPPHIESEIEHPLLVVPLCPELFHHGQVLAACHESEFSAVGTMKKSPPRSLSWF